MNPSKRLGGRKQSLSQLQERYESSYLRYQRNQFTYSSHTLLLRFSALGRQQPNMQGVPLHLILVTIAKIFMMNELQLLFFCSAIQEMGWKLLDPVLNEFVDEVTDITPEYPKPDKHIQRVQLSLLLLALAFKRYLNEDLSLAEYKIRDLTHHCFERMYQMWSVKFTYNIIPEPKNLNKLYKIIEDNTSRGHTVVDYNKLVREFLCEGKDKSEEAVQIVEEDIAKDQDDDELPKYLASKESLGLDMQRRSSNRSIMRREYSGVGMWQRNNSTDSDFFH